MRTNITGVNLGFMNLDRSLINNRPKNVGVSYCAPVLAYIIDTPEGKILFETGVSEKVLDEWPAEWLAMADLSGLSAETTIEARLKELNLGPDDFRYVIQAHLHSDHAGGLRLFEDADAEILVHEDEYSYVSTLAEDENFFCHADWEFLERKTPTLLSGEKIELLPGINLVHSPGHTPGMMAMSVELETAGTVLLTSDALYTHESAMDISSEPQVFWDIDKWRSSALRLVDYAKDHDALLFPGHDETGIKFFNGDSTTTQIEFLPGSSYE